MDSEYFVLSIKFLQYYRLLLWFFRLDTVIKCYFAKCEIFRMCENLNRFFLYSHFCKPDSKLVVYLAAFWSWSKNFIVEIFRVDPTVPEVFSFRCNNSSSTFSESSLQCNFYVVNYCKTDRSDKFFSHRSNSKSRKGEKNYFHHFLLSTMKKIDKLVLGHTCVQMHIGGEKKN